MSELTARKEQSSNDPLKTIEELLADREPIEKRSEPTLYFLFREHELVYVGYSIYLDRRIRVHAADNNKDFDSFTAIRYEGEDHADIESAYIIKYRPEYNKTLPSGRYRTKGGMRKAFDIDSLTLNLILREYNIMPTVQLFHTYYDLEAIPEEAHGKYIDG